MRKNGDWLSQKTIIERIVCGSSRNEELSMPFGTRIFQGISAYPSDEDLEPALIAFL